MIDKTIQRISENIIDKGKPFYIDRRKTHSIGDSEKQKVIKYMDHLENHGIYEFNRVNGRYEPGENFGEYIKKKEKVLEIQKNNLETLTIENRDNCHVTDKMKERIKRYGETLKQLGEIKAIKENYQDHYKKDERKQ